LFKRKEASRREQFQFVEREYLKPLPGSAYELKDYPRAKVQKMGYVYFSSDKSYYSVSYRYIGKVTYNFHRIICYLNLKENMFFFYEGCVIKFQPSTN
jgi:hypothetical protein